MGIVLLCTSIGLFILENLYSRSVDSIKSNAIPFHEKIYRKFVDKSSLIKSSTISFVSAYQPKRASLRETISQSSSDHFKKSSQNGQKSIILGKKKSSQRI